MELNYKILAITSRAEVPWAYVADLKSAVKTALAMNGSPFTILYIVEKPDGSRLSIRDQEAFINETSN